MRILGLLILALLLTRAEFRVIGQTNSVTSTNQVAAPVQAEAVRAKCVQGRRIIVGRILEILPTGLVVESGYTDLLREPLDKTWLIPGTATATLNRALVEADRPDAICAGLVFLTDFPKSRTLKPKVYDYLNLHAYPAGHFTQTLPGDQKRELRRFAAGLETAIRLNLEGEKR